MKGYKCWLVFKVGRKSYSITASSHFVKRLKEREIEKEQVLRNVLSLKLDTIREMQDKGNDVMVIDTEHNFTIVIRMNRNRIILVTAINKSTNIFLKEDIPTRIIVK